MQVWRSILQQILVKKGAFLWAIDPLPYVGRSIMVVGLDTIKAGKEAPVLQALTASCNVYFTSYYSTWRVADAHGGQAGSLMKEALLHFYQKMRRMPDTVIIYRGGVSESQEMLLMEEEIHEPCETSGILAAFDALQAEAGGELDSWRSKVTMAYIMVKRSVSSRFMADDGDNLPSGSYITDDAVMPGGKVPENTVRLDFYMVSQTYVVGTARPTLYSVLYNTLTLTKLEMIQLTHRLCGVYMTFPGMVSIPAPLKYAAKLLSLLSKCQQVPKEPTGRLKLWRPNLFFV